MSDDHLKQPPEQSSGDEAIAKRSIQLASAHQIGPFKQKFRTAVVAAAPAPIEIPQAPSTACDIGEITYAIHSGGVLLREAEHQMTFRMSVGGLALSMNIDRRAHHEKLYTRFEITSKYDDYLLKHTVPMNGTIARHMIAKLKTAIQDTDIVQNIVNKDSNIFRGENSTDAATFTQYCRDNLDILSKNLPADEPLVMTPRFAKRGKVDWSRFGLSGGLDLSALKTPYISESAARIHDAQEDGDPYVSISSYFKKYADMLRTGQQHLVQPIERPFQISLPSKYGTPLSREEDAYPDAAVTLKAMPVFPYKSHAPITGQYAAFQFQRGGVKQWVQFADLNGNEINEFTIIHPADSIGLRDKHPMSKVEALKAIKIIRDEVDAKQHPWAKNVLSRLTVAAEKMLPELGLPHSIEYKDYFKLSPFSSTDRKLMDDVNRQAMVDSVLHFFKLKP